MSSGPHTIAPDANIVLFEANNSGSALYTADETAAKAATYTQYGLPPAGVVSNSWGGGEGSTENRHRPRLHERGEYGDIRVLVRATRTRSSIPRLRRMFWPSAGPPCIFRRAALARPITARVGTTPA